MSEIMIRHNAELEKVEGVEEGPESTEPVASVVRRRDERGMVSAEWVMGIIAAVALAGVLLAVVSDGAVEGGILNIVKAILSHMVGQIK